MKRIMDNVKSLGFALTALVIFSSVFIDARDLRSHKLAHRDKLSVKSDVDVVSKLLDVNSFKHHAYEETLWFMKYFATKYSDIAQLYDIGKSVQNRKIWVLEISSKPGKHQPGKPEVKLVSGIHGEEAIGKELLLQFIKLLCEKYDKDPAITRMVDSTRIHILPSMNPDGYAMAREMGKTIPGIGHTNAHGVDLNRNFPDQFFPSTSATQVETQAVEKWIESHPFVLSASLHAGSLVVTYPYDDSPSGQSVYSATPDDDVFRHLAKTYAVHHPTMHLANPKLNCTSPEEHFIDGVTNGAKWLSVAGGMQDYNYVRSNCFEVTIQVGCDKFPNASMIESYWEDNRDSLLEFINQVHTGVKGFVTDTDGKPLDGVTISISDRQHPVTTAKDGDYWRLLVPGSYEIEASLDGYKTQKKLVEVVLDSVAKLNFALKSSNSDQDDYQYDSNMNVDPRERNKEWSQEPTKYSDDDTSDFSQASSASSDDRPIRHKFIAVRRPASPEEEEDQRKDHLAKVEPPEKTVATKHAKAAKTKKSKTKLGSKVICHVRGKSRSLNGVLKWRGFLPSLAKTKENIVAGIELATDDKLGTDGTFMGKKYFNAHPKRGYFVRYKDCKIIS